LSLFTRNRTNFTISKATNHTDIQLHTKRSIIHPHTVTNHTDSKSRSYLTAKSATKTCGATDKTKNGLRQQSTEREQQEVGSSDTSNDPKRDKSKKDEHLYLRIPLHHWREGVITDRNRASKHRKDTTPNSQKSAQTNTLQIYREI